MKRSIAISAVAVMVAFASLACAEEQVGEVVKVFTNESPKRMVEAHLGDLLVFSVQGGSYPGGMIQNLKVELKGDALTKVGVWVVPVVTPEGERAVGGLDMSAFLKTAKLGKTTVTITPQGDLTEELSKTMTFTVNVVKPESFE
jgi:hypothetical protein